MPKFGFRFDDENEFLRFIAERKIALNQVVNDEDDIAEEESPLQKNCQNYLKEHGYPFVHDRSRKKNRKGIFDLIAALPGGITLWCELKSKTGRMSDEQKQEYLMLTYLGHHAFLGVKSYTKFVSIVEGLVKG